MSESSLKISDESVNKAVTEALAAQILAALTPEVRDSIIVKAIKDSISSYNVRSAVDKAVSNKAAEIARELCDTPEWSEKITESVRKGFEDANNRISAKIVNAMTN